MKRFKTISEFLQHGNLPKPEHPLINVAKIESSRHLSTFEPMTWVYDFYCVAVKRVTRGEHLKLKYGQQPYDFNEGLMAFVSPNQILSLTVDKKDEIIEQSGWILLVHPDFLWNTSLAGNIRQYDFWDYAANEALFLSAKEEEIIIRIFQNIQRECQSNIDKFSKQIITTQIESLLSYAQRFYHRQFLTREKGHHQVADRTEALLTTYFNSNDLVEKGLPTVQYLAAQLNLSPKYLSDLLRTITGKTAQQHIHDKLIEKAKEKLSVTDLSVSEISYGLGFKHLQSFSKLFKTKTNQSPLDFRKSFQ